MSITPTLNTIDNVIKWIRMVKPESPYITIYSRYQESGNKKPSDIIYRSFANEEDKIDIDEAVKNVQNILEMHAPGGGQFTVFAKATSSKNLTSGQQVYLNLMPSFQNGYGQPSVNGLIPQYQSETEIERRINDKVELHRLTAEIKGLNEELDFVQNDKSIIPFWQQAAVGLLNTLISKVPPESIGKIFENFVSKTSPEAANSVVQAASMYIQKNQSNNDAADNE